MTDPDPSSPISRRRILQGSAAVGGLLTMSRFTAAPARAEGPTPDLGVVTDLGEPVHKTQTLSSAVGPGPQGHPLGYYVVEGNATTNAEFTVIDLQTEETVLQVRVPHGISSQRTLALSPVDGTVYFATSEISHVYRYVPGASDLEHLGPFPTGQRAWTAAVDEDGTPWFGSYPGGRLYSMDPETLEFTDHGEALSGEQYVRSIAPAGDTLYIGTQQAGHLLAFDRPTGTFTEIPLPPEHGVSGIESIAVRGGLLFVGTDGIFLRDLALGEWIDHLPGAGPRVSPPDPGDPDHVYLRTDGEIHRYDLAARSLEGTGLRPNAAPESWAWVDLDGTGPWLVLTYWNQGRTYSFHLATGASKYQVPDLLGAGANIIALGAGPLGSIYAGAYLSPPGLGKYDPDAGDFELLAGSGQVEGFGVFQDTLVFGRYPQASLWHYDPAQPWDLSSNPAPPLEIGEGQSRPQVFLELSALPGTVAVASVPDGGQHGGAITLWQPEAGTHEVFRHVVQDQTPVALVEHAGIVIGGTSIEGGYGIDPVTDEAVLFGWDPARGQTLWQQAPVPGTATIAGLLLDEDDLLWGIADGTTVFAVDLDSRETLHTTVLDPDQPPGRYGNSDRLRLDNGRLFGSAANRIFLMDRVTREVTTLYGGPTDDPAETVDELAQDRYGDLYFVGAGSRLMKCTLPADRAAPTVSATMSPPAPRPGQAVHVRLSASDDETRHPRIHYRVGAQEWEAYRRPVLLQPDEELQYRAVDEAGNASRIETLRAPG
jgi:hypothetical protein